MFWTRLLASSFYLALFLVSPAFAQPRDPGTNNVDEILHRLETNGTNRLGSRKLFYDYNRAVVTDYLNDSGEIEEHESKTYRIHPVGNRIASELILIDGKPAPGPEKRDWRRKAHESETGRDIPVSASMLNHFDFTLVGEEISSNRQCFVLSFRASPTFQGTEGMLDKILKHLEGRIWIDKEDYQLARADVHLATRVTILGGFAGALDQVSLVVEKIRIEPEFWLTKSSRIELKGRKLFSDFHLRAREDCSGFTLLPDSPASLEAAGK